MKTEFTDEEKLVHIQEMRLLANDPDLWNFEETKLLVKKLNTMKGKGVKDENRNEIYKQMV